MVNAWATRIVEVKMIFRILRLIDAEKFLYFQLTWGLWLRVLWETFSKISFTAADRFPIKNSSLFSFRSGFPIKNISLFFSVKKFASSINWFATSIGVLFKSLQPLYKSLHPTNSMIFQYWLMGRTKLYTFLMVAPVRDRIFRFQYSKWLFCESVIKVNLNFENLKKWYRMSHRINGHQDIMWVEVLRKGSGCSGELDPSCCCSGFRLARRLKSRIWCWLVDVAGESGWPRKWPQKSADGW